MLVGSHIRESFYSYIFLSEDLNYCTIIFDSDYFKKFRLVMRKNFQLMPTGFGYYIIVQERAFCNSSVASFFDK